MRIRRYSSVGHPMWNQQYDHRRTTKSKNDTVPDNMQSVHNGPDVVDNSSKTVTPDDTTQNSYNHYKPSVRLLQIRKLASGSCGFHLTRSKWDPYPWVSAVDESTPAAESGLRAGDCVLEVNGEDVLGLRIAEIAEMVKVESEHVTLLLWSTGWSPNCDPENICCGPMPKSLQRLSTIVQSILLVIECPVCLNTITPPAMQCQNGHLLCLDCRIRAEKCPVCRDRYTPRRAMIAEQIYTAISNAFNLCCDEDKVRLKLFGPNAKYPKPGISLSSEQQRRKTKKKNKQKYQVAEEINQFPEDEAAKLTGVNGVHNEKQQQIQLEPVAEWAVNKSQTESLQQTIYAPDSVNNSASTNGVANDIQSLQAINKWNLSTTYIDKSSLDPQAPSSGTSTRRTNKIAIVNRASRRFSLSTNDLLQNLTEQQREQQGHKSKEQQQLSIISNQLNDSLLAIRCCNGNSKRSSSLDGNIPVGSALPLAPRDSSFISLLHFEKQIGNSIDSNDRHLPLLNSKEDFSITTPIPVEQSSLPTAETKTQATITTELPSISSAYSSFNSTNSFTTLDLPLTSTSSSQRPNDCTSKDELLSVPTTLLTTADPQTKAQKLSMSFQLTEEPSSASSTSSASLSMIERSLAPVGTSSSMNMAPTLPPPPFLLNGITSKLLHKSRNWYRCPCHCEETFATAIGLEEHVKTVHQLPLLSFGSAIAEFALPLRKPVDNVVLVLELSYQNGNDNNKRAIDTQAYNNNKNEETIPSSSAKDISDSVDAATKDDADSMYTQKCWIHMRMQGEDSVEATVVLQPSAYASSIAMPIVG